MCFSCFRPALRDPTPAEQADIRISKPLGDKWKYTSGTDERGRFYRHVVQLRDREGNPHSYTYKTRALVDMNTVFFMQALKNCYRSMSYTDARYYLTQPIPVVMKVTRPNQRVVGRGDVRGPGGYGSIQVVEYDYNVAPVAYGILFKPCERSQHYHFFHTNGTLLECRNRTEAQARANMRGYAFQSRGFPNCFERKPDQLYHVAEPYKKRFKEERGIRSDHNRARRAEEIFRQLQAKERTFGTAKTVVRSPAASSSSSSSSSSTTRAAASKLNLRNFEGKESLKLTLEQAKEALQSNPEGLQFLIVQYADKPHVDTATTLNNVGSAYRALKDYTKAKVYYELSLAMYEKVQGDDPRVANLLNRLGIVYGDLKETDKEINCYLRSIAMYERLYADKPDDAYAYVLNNLGITYKDLKQFTQAIEYYERAHKMFEQLYGVAHAKTKETSEGVSFCRMNAAPSSSSSSSTIRTAVSKLDLKDFEGKESLKLMLEQAQEALRSDPEGLQALIEQYVDKPHVDTAATLDNVGRSYHILKDYAQARGYYELSLAMYEKQVEGDNSEIASLLSRLGIVYDKLGEGDKKINCFLRSIAMYEKLYVDKPDDDYATALKNLGVTYKDLKQFTQAIEYLERSHKMFEQLYGPNHIKTRKASGWASFCRMKLQDPQKPSSSSS